MGHTTRSVGCASLLCGRVVQSARQAHYVRTQLDKRHLPSLQARRPLVSRWPAPLKRSAGGGDDSRAARRCSEMVALQGLLRSEDAGLSKEAQSSQRSRILPPEWSGLDAGKFRTATVDPDPRNLKQSAESAASSSTAGGLIVRDKQPPPVVFGGIRSISGSPMSSVGLERTLRGPAECLLRLQWQTWTGHHPTAVRCQEQTSVPPGGSERSAYATEISKVG